MPVAVNGQGYTLTLDNLREQHKVTLGIFLLAKQGVGNGASGVIYRSY